MTLLPEKFCIHEGGMSLGSDDTKIRCSDCGAPMAWVTVSSLTSWADVRIKIRSLITAEETVLRDRTLSRMERACHKATRDALRLAVDIMDESGVEA